MTPSISPKWDWAILGFILLIASYILFVPPVIGVANQGDYARITWRVGLMPPAERAADEFSRSVCWIILPWHVAPTPPLTNFSTGEFPVHAAILLHGIADKIAGGSTTLDMRWVSAVELALLAALILAILRNGRKLPLVAYVVIAAGLVLVSTDSEYVAYFNSFFGESSAMIGVYAFVAAALAVVTTDDPNWGHLGALVLAAAFFTGSKAQNAALCLFAAVWLVWLFWRKPAHRYASIVLGLALAGFAAWVLSRAPLPQSNLFNAIYDRVLPNATDRPAVLAELGLKAETAVWMERNYWEVNIPSPDVYPGKVTRLKLAMFYLRHPQLDIRMAREALTFSNELSGLGNYAQESGAPCATRTTAFVEYDRFRMRLANIWFLVAMLVANLAAVFIWRNRIAGLFGVLAAMAATAFLIAAFYDTAPQKHLFTFNLLFDVLLFADVAAGAAGLARRCTWFFQSRTLLVKWLKPAIGLLLLVFAGMALWRDVIAKTAPTQTANLALNRLATQSSILPGSPSSDAMRAVDGNTDGSFSSGSVSSTNLEASPWWQVDLGASHAIGSLQIWNRTDCCPERLSDYWVFISDSPLNPTDTPSTLLNRAGVWKSHQTAPPGPTTAISTAGVKGRYVRVQLSGRDYLSLAEVIVSPFPPNLALGRPASQSSTLLGAAGGAGAAVDGNTDGNFFRGSVTSTNADPQAWWQVDLGATKSISSIAIWNRTDCCSSRLSDYWIFISDAPFGPRDTPATLRDRNGTWRSHQTEAPSSTVIRTDGAAGRYVRVQLDGTDYLSLAEVQVFGQ